MKKWYQSKTMWFNIAGGVGAVAGIVMLYLPLLEIVIPPSVYAITLFVVTVVNGILRKVTTTGIK